MCLSQKLSEIVWLHFRNGFTPFILLHRRVLYTVAESSNEQETIGSYLVRDQQFHRNRASHNDKLTQ